MAVQWRVQGGGKGPYPDAPRLMTNSVKYVPPGGFLWHSDFTKFNFGQAPPRTPLGEFTTLP